MMKEAKQWEITINPLIFHSADKNYIKILCGTSLMGTPQEVAINQKIQTQMVTTPELIETNAELFKDVERQVSTELWSQHDADVGLVKSASPIRIQLKPDARLPRKPQ